MDSRGYIVRPPQLGWGVCGEVQDREILSFGFFDARFLRQYAYLA